MPAIQGTEETAAQEVCVCQAARDKKKMPLREAAEGPSLVV